MNREMPEFVIDLEEPDFSPSSAREYLQKELERWRADPSYIPIMPMGVKLRRIGPDAGSRRPKIVVLSGSSQFIDSMAIAAWKEECAGHIALSCHMLPNWYKAPDGSPVQMDHQAEAEGLNEVLDQLHLRKIDMADEMLVIDQAGDDGKPYIGESTRREIAYANARGIPVRYLSQEMPDWIKWAFPGSRS